jgi:hypothetical protein
MDVGIDGLLLARLAAHNLLDQNYIMINPKGTMSMHRHTLKMTVYLIKAYIFSTKHTQLHNEDCGNELFERWARHQG